MTIDLDFPLDQPIKIISPKCPIPSRQFQGRPDATMGHQRPRVRT